MGLDMYLYEKKYISRYAALAADREEYRAEFALADEILGLADLVTEEDGGVEVKATVMYWRKANQIHNWFVTNLGSGVDEGQEVYVSREQLIELRDTCQEVLDRTETQEGLVSVGKTLKGSAWEEITESGLVITNPEVAQELLPTTSGFFFGSTDYNQFYLDDLRRTVEGIDRVLANQKMVSHDDGREYLATDFAYYASW